MIVEATKRLKVRLPDQDIWLEPGSPAEIPDEQAHRLLRKAPGKVRVVSKRMVPGSMITWFSPLFGLLSGELLAVLDDGQIEVFHPLTEKLVRIPQAWLCQEQ